MAGTGYVRDRDREFHDPAPPSKAEALRRLDEAVDLAIATVEAQTADGLGGGLLRRPGADGIRDRFAMFLRAATHFHHHVGQMIYLAKEHARQAEAAAQRAAASPSATRTRTWSPATGAGSGRFYEQALGCVRLDPERELSGDWLSRGTGVPGARIVGAHYRMPGGGPSGGADARDLSVPSARGGTAAAGQSRRVRPHRVRGAPTWNRRVRRAGRRRTGGRARPRPCRSPAPAGSRGPTCAIPRATSSSCRGAIRSEAPPRPARAPPR